MSAENKTLVLQIQGMTCVSCQNKIQRKLSSLPGVETVQVSYQKGTARLRYDSGRITPERIAGAVEQLGYTVGEAQQSGARRAAGFALLIAALYFITERLGLLTLLSPSRLAEAGMDYGMLFIIGLTTSVHCVAMCGGINLSQSMACGGSGGCTAALRPSLLYNLGRVISYTAVGFAVGALGGVFSMTNAMQGALKLIAGLFMVIMGVNMLGIFPGLRRFTPGLPAFLRPRSRSSSPFVIGLLNGLMPCGPLQAMQIYALSTGSAVMGAISMLLFSLGTVPLMFLLGAAGGLIGRRGAKRVLSAGAVLVAVLGLSMLTQGAGLVGIGGALSARRDNRLVMEDGVQVVYSTLEPGRYPAIEVSAGMPVKWIIDAPEGSINGCNNRIFIPEYGIEHTFRKGENVITFTPEKEGSFLYSCWMGMIRSTITVT